MDLGRLRSIGSFGSRRVANTAALPIAIDFGAGSLKVIQLAPGEPMALVSAAAIETPDELIGNPSKRLAFQVQALPDLIRAGAFRGKRAVCGMPAGHTIVKHMQVGRTPGVSLAETVEQTLSLQLGCPQGSILVRAFEVNAPSRAASGTGAKSEAICIAAGRDLVTGLMKAIKDAKLEPVGIQAEPLATLRAFDHVNGRDEAGQTATLYLDIGAHSTNLTIGHAREIVFARKIDFGGHMLDELIHKQTGCSIASARSRRLAQENLCAPQATQSGASGGTGMAALDAAMSENGAQAQHAGVAVASDHGFQPSGFGGADHGRSDSDVGAVNLSEPLEILADEISMCLRYHGSLFPDAPLSRAIFLGGESRHLGLCQYVAKALRLPAQVADPMARVARTGTEMVAGVDFASPQPGWAVPLGLGLCPTDL